jgi:hypothetical protein
MIKRNVVQAAHRGPVTIMATCPNCGSGVRVSANEVKLDANGCELLDAFTPLSCMHLRPVISVVQELLEKL